MGLDTWLSVAMALLTMAMAYLGVHVTLHPAESPKARRGYKVGFTTCAAAAVALVVWQGIRNTRSQRSLLSQISGLNGDISGLKDQTSLLQGDLADTKNQVNDARRDQSKESGRRQKAEEALALMVKDVGRSTREGVSQDIKRSPIQVHVSGGSTEAPPLQSEDVRIVETIDRPAHADAPFAAKWILQANVPISLLRRRIRCNVPLSHVDWRPTSGLATFVDGIPAPVRILEEDKSSIVIDLHGGVGPVISPEQSLAVFVSSGRGPIKIKSIEVGPR